MMTDKLKVQLEAAVNRIETLEQLLEKTKLELESWNLQSGDEATTDLIKRVTTVLAS